MQIVEVEKRNNGTLRVVTDEALPNGNRFIELFPHFNRKTQTAQYESASIVIELLSKAVAEHKPE